MWGKQNVLSTKFIVQPKKKSFSIFIQNLFTLVYILYINSNVMKGYVARYKFCTWALFYHYYIGTSERNQPILEIYWIWKVNLLHNIEAVFLRAFNKKISRACFIYSIFWKRAFLKFIAWGLMFFKVPSRIFFWRAFWNRVFFGRAFSEKLF